MKHFHKCNSSRDSINLVSYCKHKLKYWVSESFGSILFIFSLPQVVKLIVDLNHYKIVIALAESLPVCFV